MKVTYANMDGCPAIIVEYDGGQIRSHEKTPIKGWREDREVFLKAKVVEDKAIWDRMFPDARMPIFPSEAAAGRDAAVSSRAAPCEGSEPQLGQHFRP